MLRKEEATPFGKNPDYFFSRGVDQISSGEIGEAIKSFAKGIHDKSTHFLCRFGLGFALFKVGNFTAAAREYDVLAHQCLVLGLHSKVKFPQVLYNKSVSELQCGHFQKAGRSAEIGIAILKEKEQQSGGSFITLPKRDQEMLINLLQLQGLASFRGGDIRTGGFCFEAADFRLAIVEQNEIEATNKREGLRASKSAKSLSYMDNTDAQQSIDNTNLSTGN